MRLSAMPGSSRQGQIWSMDLVIAVVVFLLVIGIVIFFTSNRSGRDQARLRIESQLIADKLASSEGGILNQSMVREADISNLVVLSVTDYEALKRDLGVRDDFCIVFLDKDDRLLLLSGENRTGIGNRNLTLNLTGLLVPPLSGNTSFRCGDIYR